VGGDDSQTEIGVGKLDGFGVGMMGGVNQVFFNFNDFY